MIVGVPRSRRPPESASSSAILLRCGLSLIRPTHPPTLKPSSPARVFSDSIERDVLADEDRSHFGSPFVGVVNYHLSPVRQGVSS